LVECRLETGRTHQIRVHLTARGHTVVGDPLYGGTRRNSALALPQKAALALENWRRQALHAFRLGFKHPLSGELIELECDPPDDMAALLAAGRSG
jgi:23S rRNA pseudouridine1911/1915/1917 synthase